MTDHTTYGRSGKPEHTGPVARLIEISRIVRSPHLSQGARLALIDLLLRCYDDDERVCWPSLATRSKALGVSTRTLTDIDTELLARSCIRIERTGRTNRYHLLPLPSDLAPPWRAQEGAPEWRTAERPKPMHRSDVVDLAKGRDPEAERARRRERRTRARMAQLAEPHETAPDTQETAIRSPLRYAGACTSEMQVSAYQTTDTQVPAIRSPLRYAGACTSEMQVPAYQTRSPLHIRDAGACTSEMQAPSNKDDVLNLIDESDEVNTALSAEALRSGSTDQIPDGDEKGTPQGTADRSSHASSGGSDASASARSARSDDQDERDQDEHQSPGGSDDVDIPRAGETPSPSCAAPLPRAGAARRTAEPVEARELNSVAQTSDQSAGDLLVAWERDMVRADEVGSLMLSERRDEMTRRLWRAWRALLVEAGRPLPARPTMTEARRLRDMLVVGCAGDPAAVVAALRRIVADSDSPDLVALAPELSRAILLGAPLHA